MNEQRTIERGVYEAGQLVFWHPVSGPALKAVVTRPSKTGQRIKIEYEIETPFMGTRKTWTYVKPTSLSHRHE